MKILLTEIYSKFLLKCFNVKTIDIVNTQLNGLLGITATSLGKDYEKFEKVRKELGDSEFELYIQCNIEAQKETINKRGFYPSILVNDKNSLQNYLDKRDIILENWGNPSNRFKSKLFSKLFPSECKFIEEYISQYSKGNHDPSEMDIINQVSNLLNGEWLVSRIKYESKNLITDQLAYRRYMASKANSKKDKWEKEIPFESYKAMIFGCIEEGKKLIGKKINEIEITEVSMDKFSVETQFVTEISKYIQPSNSQFSIIDNES